MACAAATAFCSSSEKPPARSWYFSITVKPDAAMAVAASSESGPLKLAQWMKDCMRAHDHVGSAAAAAPRWSSAARRRGPRSIVTTGYLSASCTTACTS